MNKVANLSRNRVIKALRSCIDPELGVDIVSLGLVYDVQVKGRQATITMTLTTPGCPLWSYFEQRINDLVVKTGPVGTKLKIILTFEPAWEPEMVDPRSSLITK